MIKVYIMADSRFDASKLAAKNGLDIKEISIISDRRDVAYMVDEINELLWNDSKPALNDRKPVVWLSGAYLQHPAFPLLKSAIDECELEYVIK